MAGEELVVERKPYTIGDKTYYLWDDFDFDEKEWLDVVYSKLTAHPPAPSLREGEKNNEINGSFTAEEILKTLSVILRNEDGSYIGDRSVLRKTRESLQAKIIADFFLSKAILGIITTNFSKLSEQEKKMHQTASMN